MTPDNNPKDAIRQLTKDMEEQIRGGTLDAPSWEILRIGTSHVFLFDESTGGTTIVRTPWDGSISR